MRTKPDTLYENGSVCCSARCRSKSTPIAHLTKKVLSSVLNNYNEFLIFKDTERDARRDASITLIKRWGLQAHFGAVIVLTDAAAQSAFRASFRSFDANRMRRAYRKSDHSEDLHVLLVAVSGQIL